MHLDTLFAWTLLAPAALAISIDAHLSTETTVLCSTIYGKTHVSSTPTSTSLSPFTIDLSPVILHNSTTLTKTVTPDPFNTLYSILTTKTKWVSSTPVDGTFYTTKTNFGTSTFWHHTTTTSTETQFRYLTSRTIEWIAAPTGFMPVKNTTFAPDEQVKDERKREISHPRAVARALIQKPKPRVVRPTFGRFAVEVACKQQVRVHTTEVLMFMETKRATVTLRPETVFTNRTVYGTITSTVLILSSPSSSSSAATLLVAREDSTAEPTVRTGLKSTTAESAAQTGAESTTAAAASSSATATSTSNSASSTSQSSSTSSTSLPPLPTGPNGIATYLHHKTTTPYTITFTHTATATTTTTLTRHATTTITSHSACATSNSLFQTSGNKRINGVSLFENSDLEMLHTADAGGCCEVCVQRLGCLWGVWEAAGESVGACYLVLSAQRAAEGVCERQDIKGFCGFSGGNGEVRYVVSNGICGLLSEA